MTGLIWLAGLAWLLGVLLLATLAHYSGMTDDDTDDNSADDVERAWDEEFPHGW